MMKHIFTFLLLAGISLGAVHLDIPEGTTVIGYFAYENRTDITSVSIPSSVTSIGGGAFQGCTSLTSITIPPSVTSIGDGAFSGCTGLTSVTIPSGVTSIGDGAFQKCTSLTSVSIPSGVTSIGYWAFSGCTSLASIVIPPSVTSIGDGAFSGCTGLASIHVSEGNGKYRDIDGVLYDYALTELVAWPSGVTECPGLPSSVTSIGDHAFSGCTGLASIAIPSGVTSIGDGAFEGCTSLTSIVIPSGVTSIGEGAFLKCTSLASVAIPSGVTSIGERAFEDCTSLTSVAIPSGVTYIRGSAFSGCRGIAFVKTPGCFEMRCTFPDSLRSIAEVIIVEGEEKICEGFASGCSALTSLTLPESLKTIGDYAFRDCTSLTSITIPSGVTSIGYSAFEDCTSLTSVTIPEGVRSIGGDAFSGCRGIAFVKTPGCFEMRYRFPDSLRSIAEVIIVEGEEEIREGFADGCSALSSLTLPESLKTIGREAFKDCTSLTFITIPSSVTSIGYSAFEDCTSLTSITIPSGVTSIEWDAFRGCTSLTSVTISEGVTSIGGGAFEDCTSLTSVTIPEGVTSIDGDAFRGCTSLTSVAIPSGVTSIGGWAFEGCTSLTSVTIPSSVTSIGGGAFASCSGLTSIHVSEGNREYRDIDGVLYDYALTELVACPSGVTECPSIPSSVTSIGYSAFRGCTSLTSVTIPSGVTSIGERAFRKCTSLASIVIPSGVTSIGSDAFADCTSLTSVTIPSGVTSIEGCTFYGCTSLTSVTIPSGVTSIGEDAFYECTSLASIVIPSGVTSIGYGAFAGCSALETLYFPGTPDDAMSWIAFMPAVTLHVFSDQGWREELDEDGTFFGLPVVIGGMANLALTADFDRLDCMAGRSEIRIATNAAWTAESNVPWLRLAKTSGIGSTTLEFEFDENAGPAERAGAVFVRLTDYGLNKPIGVVQERFQFAEGEMKYVVEDGIAVVTGCRPEGSAIIVPGILGGRPVGRIEDGAFARAGQVTSLVFQGTVPEYAGEGRLLDAPGAAITAFRSNEAIDYGWDGVTVFGGLPVTLAAQAASEDGEWIYCVNADGEALLQRYQGSRLTVDIPAQVAGRRVAGVWGCSRRQNGAYDILGAFTGNAYVRQITVPDDVADLYAGFSGCASLKNILFLGRPPKVTGGGTLFPAKGARINAFEGNGWEDILEENGTFHGTDVTLHPDPVSQGTVASGDFDGGEMLISIAALDAWSIEGLPEWVRASMTSGTGNATVKLEFRENPDTAPRHALLRVLLGCGLADNVAISQAGQVPRRLTCVNATSDVTSAIKGTAATLKIVMPAGEDAANLQIAWEASTECGLTVSPDKLSATVTIPASDLTVSARFLRRIELEEGWNLLCVSRELDEEALAQLDDIGVSAVRDMAIAQVPASSLARGEGFWLWSDGEREIWLKFSDADADETKDDVLSSVETCLVGLPDSRCAAEQSVPDGLTLWEYADNGWKQVPVAPDGRATLVPYKSYMVLGK